MSKFSLNKLNSGNREEEGKRNNHSANRIQTRQSFSFSYCCSLISPLLFHFALFLFHIKINVSSYKEEKLMIKNKILQFFF